MNYERSSLSMAVRLSAAAVFTGSVLLAGGCSSEAPEHGSNPGIEQTVAAPSPSAEQPTSNCETLEDQGFTTYVIEPGDTIASISRAVDVDADALQKFNVRSNAITDPGDITAGNCVTVPTSSTEHVSDEMFSNMRGLSWRSGCIGQASLRLVRVPYFTMDGDAAMGALIVNKRAANSIGNVFEEIVAADDEFRIQAVTPVEGVPGVEAFRGGDPTELDEHIMSKNYTTVFNCRPIKGSKVMSKHSRGLAIDVNPRTNPMVSSDGTVSPANGEQFLDRDANTPGLLTDAGQPGKTVVDVFKRQGYEWGGDWKSLKDWQHFELAS